MYIDNKFVEKYDGMITHCLNKAGVRGDRFDDIKSKVYERIIEAENYDESKGKISTWLWYVIRSVISNEKKRASRSKDALDQESVSIKEAEWVVGVEDAGTAEDELNRLFRGAPISKRDESILKDFYLEDYSAQECADRYNMEVRAVQQVIYRSMKALRQIAEA